MTSPRDEIDDWLEGEVRPLYPQPGSLDQIRHRARQRKTRQALLAAAGCAVVLAGAVTVPQLVGASGQAGGPKPPAAAGSTSPSISSGTSNTASSSASAATNSSSPFQQHSYLSATTSGFSVPAHFEPTSVTFVGVGGGNVVGAVIGQAGPPCSTSSCTSLAGTSDYGSTWYGVSAPEVPGPDGSTGVSQLRFADLRHGWAFGPALYETSDGGWPWNPEKTHGQRVIDVEAAAGGPALGVFATCTGTGPNYAADCTSFSLYTSVGGTRTWTPITLPISSMSTGQAASASLVVTHTTGYLLAPTGDVLTGPVSGGTWRLAGKAPCAPGPAQASGLPSQAQLVTSPQQLMLVCVAGSTPASSLTTVYTSTDGSAWQIAGSVPQASSVTSAASGTARQAVLATPTGIYQSADDGATWQHASVAGGTPARGFSYVGMTNATNGIAMPANAELGRVYITTDGGLHWRPSSVTS